MNTLFKTSGRFKTGVISGLTFSFAFDYLASAAVSAILVSLQCFFRSYEEARQRKHKKTLS